MNTKDFFIGLTILTAVVLTGILTALEILPTEFAAGVLGFVIRDGMEHFFKRNSLIKKLMR